jgi:hypothetical protein
MIKISAHLKTFLTLAVSLIVCTMSAYSQIRSIVAGDSTTTKVVYHNIPDITFVESWSSYERDMDINENGSNDINFQSTFHSHTTEIIYDIRSNPINGCWFAEKDSSAYPQLKVFKIGDSIDNRCFWSKCCNQSLVYKMTSNVPPYGTSYGGDWLNQSNKYLGVRYIENHDTLFAWVELSGWKVGLSIQSYAYMKSSPDIVTVKKTSDFHVYPNPASEFIIIEIPEPVTESYITISDVSGQVLIKYNTNKSTTQIDISCLKRGFYMVQLINSEKVYAIRKIIIE